MPKQPKRRPGRPKLPRGEAKGKIVPVRLDAEDLSLATSAARERKQILSEWIRDTLRDAAEKQMYKRTLHDAIATVLMGRPALAATTSELGEEIGRRGLYARRDGTNAKARQINARVRKHPELFALDASGLVRLLGNSKAVPSES